MAVGFYHNSTICTECKACQIACKDIHDFSVGINLRKVTCVEGGSYPKPWVYFVSMSCNHCENPACMEVCPAGAIVKDTDGTVCINKSQCIGCKSCVTACPYGAPKYVEEKAVTMKCDGCRSRRKEGLNPLCVDACLMRALEFGDIDELKAKHAGENLRNDLPPLADPSITTPNFIIGAKDISASELANYSVFGVM